MHFTYTFGTAKTAKRSSLKTAFQNNRSEINYLVNNKTN